MTNGFDFDVDESVPILWEGQTCRHCQFPVSVPTLKEDGHWIHLKCYHAEHDAPPRQWAEQDQYR